MCTNCNDIEINTVTDGYNGWSPELGVSTNCTGKSVLRLISWIPGSGDRPSFNGNIMTDQYLIDNPIYLGVNGFTDACDEATDITGDDGAVGANGPTGEQGNQGAPGTNGCNPNITITAEVSGEGEVRPYPVTVLQTGEGAPCNPEYSFIFPIEMITENAELTTAIDAAISGLLAPAETMISPLTISDTGSPDVLYSEFVTSTSLSFNTLSTSYISYKVIGNLMYLNFRFVIDVPPGPTPRITNFQVKIPAPYLSVNTTDVSAISRYSVNLSTVTYTPLISTNNVNNGYLIISAYNDNTNLTSFGLKQGSTEYFQGQITFTITN